MAQAQIQRIRYTHDAMIDFIVANPRLRQREIANWFGMSEGWVSQVFSSDVFQARLAERKKELVDVQIVASLEEGFQGLARQSMAIIQEKLEANPTADFALEVMQVSSKALGFGARQTGGAQVTNHNNVVVMVPQKSESSEAWANAYANPVVQTIEAKKQQ